MIIVIINSCFLTLNKENFILINQFGLILMETLT